MSNATGIATNQNAFVTDQAFDTNKFDFTTNWFQAYDVPLTNGVNHVTLRVSDRAGNMTTTNFNVTLNYSGATNPVVSLAWPTNGMELCGSSFTLRGMVDDPCASVSATVTDTNGNVNTIAGEVERSGVLWVENLPLAEGTNWITLNVTNAAGHSSETNMSVVKSDMTLMVTNISGDLWQPPVNVSGFVSDTTAAIYVNGLKGTNYGNGTWEVDNVPLSASGVASFDVNAIPGGGGDPAINTNVDKAPEILIVKYDETTTDYNHDSVRDTNNTVWTRHYLAGLTVHAGGMYYETNCGYSDISNYGFHEGWPYSYDDQFSWSDTDPAGLEIYTVGGVLNYVGPVLWGSWMDSYYQAAMAIPDGAYYYGDAKAPYQWHDAYSIDNLTVGAATQLKLYTGGRALSGQKNLFCINARADEYDQVTDNIDYYVWEALNSRSVDKTRLEVGTMGSAGGDGNLWVALADNAEPDVTVVAPGIKHYNAWASPTKYELVHQTVNPALTDTNLARLNLGVGEEVDFHFSNEVDGSITAAASWSKTAGFLDYSSGFEEFEALDTAQTATVTVTAEGVTLPPVTFNVLEPSGIATNTYKVNEYTNYFHVGNSGAGMYIRVYIAPTDVSFYRVQCMEVGEDATNITGYYTNYMSLPGYPSNLSHIGQGANDPFQINTDNSWEHTPSRDWDNAWWQNLTPPPSWSAGGFIWNIPGAWTVDGSTWHTNMTPWSQVFTNQADGTMTIQKFGLSVTRNPSSP